MLPGILITSILVRIEVGRIVCLAFSDDNEWYVMLQLRQVVWETFDTYLRQT